MFWDINESWIGVYAVFASISAMIFFIIYTMIPRPQKGWWHLPKT